MSSNSIIFYFPDDHTARAQWDAVPSVGQLIMLRTYVSDAADEREVFYGKFRVAEISWHGHHYDLNAEDGVGLVTSPEVHIYLEAI